MEGLNSIVLLSLGDSRMPLIILSALVGLIIHVLHNAISWKSSNARVTRRRAARRCGPAGYYYLMDIVRVFSFGYQSASVPSIRRTRSRDNPPCFGLLIL